MSTRTDYFNTLYRNWRKPFLLGILFSTFFIAFSAYCIKDIDALFDWSDKINDIAIQISITVIAALFTVIAIIQTVAANIQDSNVKLKKVASGVQFKQMKKSQYHTICIATLLIFISLVFETVKFSKCIPFIMCYIGFECVLLTAITLSCLKHFKVLIYLI